MRKSQLDEPLESPVSFHAGSNGEFAPLPPDPRAAIAESHFRRLVDESSRQLGISRRDFLRSSCGTAAALLVIDQTFGCGGPPSDPVYIVPAEATRDPAAACAALRGSDFVFDVHTHHVDTDRAWTDTNFLAASMRSDAAPRCPPTTTTTTTTSSSSSSSSSSDALACWSAEHFIREIFIKSETAIACLTLFPGLTVEARPLFDREAAATRELVDRLARSPRLVIHGMVSPELGPAQLDDMQRMKEESRISGWKVYPQYGGWRLDDPKIGIPFLERARRLQVPLICAHKGITFPDVVGAARFGSPADIGPAAALFPDLQFLVYHAGYEPNVAEGPYDPNGGGIDRLIRSLLSSKIAPNANVYADLGTTWRLLMTKPLDAAHALGKLLLYVGADRVLWGTDSLWHGTPQPQIEAFRAFEIPTSLQEKHGYPALTRDLKAKILGLNGARVYGIDPAATRCAITEDALSKQRAAHEADPLPRLGPQGPRTHDEYLAHLQQELLLRRHLHRSPLRYRSPLR